MWATMTVRVIAHEARATVWRSACADSSMHARANTAVATFSATAVACPLGQTDGGGGGWWGQDSNLRRQSQRVYSPSPLTAREPHRAVRESSARPWAHRCALNVVCAVPTMLQQQG